MLFFKKVTKKQRQAMTSMGLCSPLICIQYSWHSILVYKYKQMQLMIFQSNKLSRMKITLLYVFTLFDLAYLSTKIVIVLGQENLVLETIEPQEGSMEGGTKVKITGKLDKTIEQVKIGDLKCEKIESFQHIYECSTAKCNACNESTNTYRVNIVYQGKIEPQKELNYTYSQRKTSTVLEISPSSVTPESTLNIFGYHKITKEQLSKKSGFFFINDTQCALINQQKTQTNQNNRQPLTCQVNQTLPAGQYSFRQTLPAGDARVNIKNRKTSYLTNKNYTVRVIPQIKHLSSHEGSFYGNKIQVQGSGFSNNMKEIGCSISGENCSVKKISSDRLQVTVQKKVTQNTGSGQLTTVISNNQSKSYIGSHGALYSKFSINEAMISLQKALQIARQNQRPYQIIPELSSELRSKKNQGEYVRGYFKAPVTGNYNFSAHCDGHLLMKIVKENKSLQTLLLVESRNSNHELIYLGNYSTVQELKEDHYYFFELVKLNYESGGFFKVDVQMPQLPIDTPVANPTWEIRSITIMANEFQFQQLNLTIQTKGQIAIISVLDMKQTQFFKGGISEKELDEILSSLPQLNYSKEINITMTNADNVTVLEKEQATTYYYIITFKEWRPYKVHIPLINYTKIGQNSSLAHFNRSRQSSKELSGNYEINIQNEKFTFDVKKGEKQIQVALNQRFNQTDSIVVVKNPQMNNQSRIEYLIEFVGLPSVGEISITTQNIQGGKNNEIYNISTIVRNYSSQPLYSPVPYDFLYILSDKPALTLSSSDIPALCSDCSYTILGKAMSPYIQSFNQSKNKITLSIMNRPSIQSLQISLMGIICKGKEKINETDLTCEFEKNPNGQTAKLPAGKAKVQVFAKNLGVVNNDKIQEVQIPLVVSGIQPSVVGEEGNIHGSLSGSGFPLVNDSSFLTLCLKGTLVTQFNLISNTYISFIFPKKSKGPDDGCRQNISQIKFNNLTTEIPEAKFKYDNSVIPTITNLSIKFLPPWTQKENLTIQGKNFGTQPQVSLVQVGTNQSTPLNCSNVTDTKIQCELTKQKLGKYWIRILNTNSGWSQNTSESIIRYGIFIKNLSIEKGHLGGGYNLSIFGYNFHNESKVSIDRNQCKKLYQKKNEEIVCKVDRMPENVLKDSRLEVKVTAPNYSSSQCLIGKDKCTFTYVDQGTPLITSKPQIMQFSANSTLILECQNMANFSITIGGIKCQIINQQRIENTTKSRITFKYPELKAGQYQIIISTPTGNNYPKLISKNPLEVTPIFQIQRSLEGKCTHLLVHGNGFPKDSNISNNLTCGKVSQKLVLSSRDFNELTFILPSFFSDSNKDGCSFSVEIQHINKLFQNINCDYSFRRDADDRKDADDKSEMEQQKSPVGLFLVLGIVIGVIVVLIVVCVRKWCWKSDEKKTVTTEQVYSDPQPYQNKF